MESSSNESEMKSFIKVCVITIASLTYCYFISFNVSKGKTRLLSFLPVIFLFTILPLNLTTLTLTGTLGFFLQLANLKLLLFAFHHQPLASNPPLPLSRFICLAFLPIKIATQNTKSTKIPNPPLKNLTLRCATLVFLWLVYKQRQHLHPNIMLAFYCCYIYVATEMLLAISAFTAWAVLGLELEPHFDEPYLSSSLQDFWGRRWNLNVSNALRSTVYKPVKVLSARAFGTKYASLPAVLAAFLASGLMHELLFFYFGRLRPTWEVTWFFVIHGLGVAIEIVVKKVVKERWRLSRVVSGPVAVGFVMVTAMWLFFPPALRCDAVVRTEREVGAVVDFFKFLITISSPLVTS